MSMQNRSPVFVARLPGGLLAQALPNDEPGQAAAILHRLLPVLPPVDEAYVVPDSTLMGAQ